MQQIVIAGSTGLIGQHMADLCPPDASREVTLLARRTFQPPHPEQHVLIADFAKLALPETNNPSSLALCALGTTIKTAGSQAAFQAVDLTMVVQFARATKQAGYTRFGVVSSVGADANSRNFYLRTKGEMERALTDMAFEHLLIAQPSLLLGERNEFRLGEQLAQKLSPLLAKLTMGPFRRYIPVQARAVAGFLLDDSHYQHTGVRMATSDEIVAG